MELSKLSIKCLENMPMLTDTMATAINELYNALSPYYEDYCEFLNKEIVSDKQGGFKLKKDKVLFFENLNKTLPLTKINMSFGYAIYLDQNKKINPIALTLFFDYGMDKNYLYFQLSESSETQLVKSLLKNADFIKSKSVSQEYQYENSEDEKNVWLQFTIDETLSLEKIKTCSELFKANILMPILNQLK